MNEKLNILILEDIPEDAELIRRELKKEEISFVSIRVDNKQDFLKGLKEFKPDLILSDYSLPQYNGLEALGLAKEIAPEIPFIMVTGSLNEETAVECMRRGAWDYVIKEHLARLGYAVINVLKIKVENDKIIAAENELRKLSTAINQSPSTIVITDKEGIIEYVNPYFLRLTGYIKEEVIGQNPRVLKSEKTPNETYIDLWNTILSGNTWEGEFINKKKDGSLYWESAIIAPVKNNSNEITNFIAIKHDITKRKKNDQIQKVLFNISQAVITSINFNEFIGFIQKQLGTLIDTTNFFVALYNKESNTISLPFIVDQKNKFTSFPAGKTLTSYVIKTKKPLLATKKVALELEQLGEIEIIGPDSKIWLGVPLKINEDIIGAVVIQSYEDENAYDAKDMEILGFIADQISISIERKKAEQDLVNALKKATESDRLKSVFLATMSHELRTPLNAIIGFSSLINKELPIEEIDDFAKTINSSGTHLLNIVEDLFDITLIESGEIKIQKREVPLHEILNNVHNIIIAEQIKINKNIIELNLEMPPESRELIINTDPAKLKQILISLLKNALKFTHEGHINYGYCIEKDKGQPVLRFYVEDTGIGVSKENHEIIFEIFRQAEESFTRSYGGAGIGLSIAKKLTGLLGGRIWLVSEEENLPAGKAGGSTFCFTIPFEESEIISKQTIIGAKKENSLKEKTILIVEDVEASYVFLKVILEISGIIILWAKDGVESIKLCKEHTNINLILMDINMPVMNGYEATRKIREFNKDIIIIAQTAYALTGDREKSLEAGCNDYISKPINRDNLLKLINKYLAKS